MIGKRMGRLARVGCGGRVPNKEAPKALPRSLIGRRRTDGMHA